MLTSVKASKGLDASRPIQKREAQVDDHCLHSDRDGLYQL